MSWTKLAGRHPAERASCSWKSSVYLTLKEEVTHFTSNSALQKCVSWHWVQVEAAFVSAGFYS